MRIRERNKRAAMAKGAAPLPEPGKCCLANDKARALRRAFRSSFRYWQFTTVPDEHRLATR